MCTGVVVYEDVSDRDLVLRLYDRLANQFEHDLDFAFDWWRCKYLADPGIAGEAAEAATKADLIVLSFHRVAEVPPEVKSWIEGWLHKREPSGGALVAVESFSEVPGVASSQASYLRKVAKRAHLDFLPLPRPDSAAVGTKHTRRDQLAELDPAAIHQSASRQLHSSGYGINE